MGLESVTFINDLVVTNPTTSDLKTQGDDHLRAIKTGLKGSFPTSTKAWYNPTTSVKTIDFNAASTDMNTTFLVDTTAGVVTATLPSLAVGDAGWECFFIKTNTGTSPLLIAPPSGTIQSGDISGLAKTRRCIPGVRSRAFWTGSAWIVERATALPVGSVIDNPHRSTLPVGYEYAMGQTLSSASTNYPDFYSANGNSGVVTDRQGRAAFGRTDMDGSDNSVITSAVAGVAGTGRGNTFGNQKATLLRSDLVNVSVGVTISGTQAFSGIPGNGSPQGAGTGTNTCANATAYSGATMTVNGSNFSGTFNLNGGVTQTDVNKLPPGIITDLIVVVE